MMLNLSCLRFFTLFVAALRDSSKERMVQEKLQKNHETIDLIVVECLMVLP